METDQLRALAVMFSESIEYQHSFSPEDRECWLKGLSEFAGIVIEAAEALGQRDAALDRISELAETSYEELSLQGKLAVSGRALRSILEAAAAARNGGSHTRHEREEHEAVLV
jgi:hypothetical protein